MALNFTLHYIVLTNFNNYIQCQRMTCYIAIARFSNVHW